MRQISINSFTLLRVRVLERRKGSAQGYMYNRQLLLPLKVTNWRAGKGPSARHIWAKKKKTKLRRKNIASYWKRWTGTKAAATKNEDAVIILIVWS